MSLQKVTNNGQAVLEYFILTTVVVALLIFFGKTRWFTGINDHMNEAFNQSADNIIHGTGAVVPPSAGASAQPPSAPSDNYGGLPLKGPTEELPGNINLPNLTLPYSNGSTGK